MHWAQLTGAHLQEPKMKNTSVKILAAHDGVIDSERNKLPGPSPYLDFLISKMTFLSIVLGYS